MELSYWLGRWERGETGWHGDSPSVDLVRYWPQLVPFDSAVLVPLCGKSLDLSFLRGAGHSVIGVELSLLAATAAFEEAGTPFTRVTDGAYEILTGAELTIICGDFFNLPKHLVVGVAAYYDRAALIAMPPERRPAYVQKVADLLPSGSQGLVSAISYPAGERTGPPFSVSYEEIQELYSSGFEVEVLESKDIVDSDPKFRAAWGLSSLVNSMYRVVRR
jgi:thiopurine S-methyltransferase